MLEVQNLIFGYGDNELFHQAELKIYQGEHVGIVGLNGTGKTTFLNLLCHRLLPDEGNISWDRHVTFSYLDQHLAIYDDQTVQAYLYDVYQPLFRKEKSITHIA